MKFITYIAFLSIVVSCATLDPTDIPSENTLLPPETITKTLTFDAFGFRVDLDRELDNNKNEKEYTDIGVYYGNGLFMDSNLNFYIDVVRLFELDKVKNFTITEITESKSYNEWIKEDNKYTRTLHGLIDKGLTFTQEEDHVLADYKSNKPSVKMLLNEDSIKYGNSGMLGAFQKFSVKMDDYYFYSQEGLQQIPLFVKNSPEAVNIKHKRMLYIEENKLLYTKHDKKHTYYTIIRNDNSFAFLKSENSGIIISYIDDVIKINKMGRESKYRVTVN